jgi:hypothetical protein
MQEQDAGAGCRSRTLKAVGRTQKAVGIKKGTPKIFFGVPFFF